MSYDMIPNPDDTIKKLLLVIELSWCITKPVSCIVNTLQSSIMIVNDNVGDANNCAIT
jgi:hypothetical protein